MSVVALYPGTFDPLTNGHLDIIQRSLAIFDRVVVAIAVNVRKEPLFSTEERMRLIREAAGEDPRLVVVSFGGLLVDYVKKCGARVVIRGLRAIADFEYEFQLAHMNRRLAPGVDTVFLPTTQENFYVSSSLVKEIARFGGDVSGVVPETVHRALIAKFAAAPRGGRRRGPAARKSPALPAGGPPRSRRRRG
jgi:pantetheine-phosphate adenylyltransferase